MEVNIEMDEDDEAGLRKPRKEILIKDEELVTLESIEHEFKNVMDGLGDDENIIQFRQEYEKLFHALKKSLHQQTYLAKKCKELSSEVTQNATKVQETLHLSQQDQNVIAMLKKDTEKAWGLVQEGKKKEQNISETVDQLQDEVNKLSKQLQDERTRAFRREEEFEGTSQDRDRLKIERDDLIERNSQLEKKGRQAENDREQIDSRLHELKQKNMKLSENIDAQTSDLIRMKSECNESDSRVVGLKVKLEQKAKDLKDLQKDAIASNKIIEQLKTELKEANKTMEKQASECKELSDQTSQLAESLEIQKNKMASISQDFKKNGEDLKLALAAQNRISSEKSQLQRKYDNERKNIKRLQQMVDDARVTAHNTQKDLQSLQQELDKTSRREDKAVGQLTMMKREKNLLSDKLQRFEQRDKELNEVVTHKDQTIMSLEKDLSNARDTIISLNKNMNSVEKLCEKHNNALTRERTTSATVHEGVRLKDVEIEEMKRELSKWETKSSEQIQMCNKLRAERGKMSRQVVSAQAEIKRLKDQIETVSTEVKRLRQELTSKDQFILKEHFETKQEKIQKDRASTELSRLKQHLEEQEGIMQKQNSEIRILNSTLKQMDDVALHQRKEYDQILNERDVLGAQLIRRNDELALMQETMKMQETTLKKGEIQYQERIADIRLLTIKIQDLKRELNCKSSGKEGKHQTSREIVRKEKELLQEKVKVKALSDELENPLNVHRWRKLDGSDPAAFELMQKVDMLQRRLIKKTEQVVEKDAIIQEQENQYSILKKQVERQPGINTAEQLSIKETEIREKERQMRAMAGELNMNQTQVSKYKKEIDKLNEEIHELKHKCFELKKREAEMKERELSWLEENGMMDLESACREDVEINCILPAHRRTTQKPIRYVGGGFKAIPHFDH